MPRTSASATVRAIAFRSYHAGVSHIPANSPGLKEAGIKIRTPGTPI